MTRDWDLWPLMVAAGRVRYDADDMSGAMRDAAAALGRLAEGFRAMAVSAWEAQRRLLSAVPVR